MSTQLSYILEISVAERIQLVEDIWDSIATTPEAIPLTDEQGQEFDCRLEAYTGNPQGGIFYDKFKREIFES